MTALTTTNDQPMSANANAWELAQRQAKAMSSSSLVPKDYQNNIANCLIALEIAGRIGCSPLMAAQNLNVIHGRPSWSSTFIIAALNTCGRFSPLRFDQDTEGCTAYALDKDTGDRLTGPRVTMTMAKAEGWSEKAGSKWKTMPELMLMYRAAAFFGRLYAPDVLMGMHTADEIEDIQPVRVSAVSRIAEQVNQAALGRDEPESPSEEDPFGE